MELAEQANGVFVRIPTGLTTGSTEWYEVDQGSDGQVSKYIGSDQTGGSSGGPWWLNLKHPTAEVAGTTDNSDVTDPGQGQPSPWINGVNSHKRCTTGGCPAGTVFLEEQGSPQFRDTPGDNNESEDVFAVCFANGG